VRAVAIERFGAPVVVREDSPVPHPARGEALVRVVAAGVCGTDVKLWRGDLPDTQLPLVPGHETAGVVEACGPGGGVEPGTRVVIFHHLFCGDCPRCRAGSENLCVRLRGRVGFDHPGGWADYLVVPTRNLVSIPDVVSGVEACVVPDAVATVWRALKTVGALVAGEGVAVVGAGGLGLAACQVAREAGAEVLAIDVREDKLAHALAAGAHHASVPAGALDAALALPQGAPELVVDCAGTPDAIVLAVSLLPPGGRLVQVGYAKDARIELAAADVALRELRVLGCRAAAICDLVAALDAVARGAVRPVVGHVRPLEEAQAAIDALVAGAAAGRQVLAVSDAPPVPAR
jgi:D-arabinose 1-dehydrogenase-like Zn-dependent alcohol dehydrogenase